MIIWAAKQYDKSRYNVASIIQFTFNTRAMTKLWTSDTRRGSSEGEDDPPAHAALCWKEERVGTKGVQVNGVVDPMTRHSDCHVINGRHDRAKLI